MEATEIFGPKLSALLAVVALAYFLFSFAPILWPAFRAFRRKTRLPRPWLFTGIVGALVYGIFWFVLCALFIPAEVYTIYLAPQLQEAGRPYGKAFVTVTGFIADYWWLGLPPLQFLSTFLVTRALAVRWERLCAAVTANNQMEAMP